MRALTKGREDGGGRCGGFHSKEDFDPNIRRDAIAEKLLGREIAALCDVHFETPPREHKKGARLLGRLES
jgi:hypothetical protein